MNSREEVRLCGRGFSRDINNATASPTARRASRRLFASAFRPIPAIDEMWFNVRYRMDKITTTIKREWLREIAAGRKRIEYREIKPYWTLRLSRVKTPFSLRLINGMGAKTPELTVIVRRIRKNTRTGRYELVLGKLVALKHWNRRLERPLA